MRLTYCFSHQTMNQHWWPSIWSFNEAFVIMKENLEKTLFSSERVRGDGVKGHILRLLNLINCRRDVYLWQEYFSLWKYSACLKDIYLKNQPLALAGEQTPMAASVNVVLFDDMQPFSVIWQKEILSLTRLLMAIFTFGRPSMISVPISDSWMPRAASCWARLSWAERKARGSESASMKPPSPSGM